MFYFANSKPRLWFGDENKFIAMQRSIPTRPHWLLNVPREKNEVGMVVDIPAFIRRAKWNTANGWFRG